MRSQLSTEGMQLEGNVYKFMSGQDYHLSSLAENQVFFSKFDELNDPYEGLLYFSFDGVTDSLRKALLANNFSHSSSISLKKARVMVERYIKSKGLDEMRKFAQSLTESCFSSFLNYHHQNRFVLSTSFQSEINQFPAPLNNMMMWSHYSNGMRGFCVEYNQKELLRSLQRLNPGIEISTKKVKYSDRELPIVRATTIMQSRINDNGDAGEEMITAFCTKQSNWKYENELRFIGSVQGLVSHDESAIKRVFVGANNQTLTTDLIRILKAKEINIPLYSVQTRPRIYGLGFSPIQY